MSKELEKAINLLKDSMPVAMPTETVYGLAAPVDNINALEKIFELKERPLFDPLIVHVHSIDMAKKYCGSWPKTAQALAEKLWPGPLTIIVKRNDLVPDIVTAGLENVGLRMPNHPIALELIQQMNVGLAAPSANKFSKTSPSKADHVQIAFNNEVYVLDGGDCQIGIESTVVEATDNQVKIYRPGMISKDSIQNIVGRSIEVFEGKSPVSPGQLDRHYQPEVDLIVAYEDDDIEELVQNKRVFEEKLSTKAVQVARGLYQLLHQIRKDSYDIAIIRVPRNIEQDSWRGILDRLKKASCLYTLKD